MKWLLILVVLILGAVTAGWFAAEPWLVTQAQRQIAARGDISVGAMAEMPGAGLLGMTATDARWQARGVTAVVPALDLWVTPTAPTTLQISAPQPVVLRDEGQQAVLVVDQGQGALRASVLGGQAQMARLTFAALTLNGQPLAGAGQMTARLADTAGVTGAASAYDVDLSLTPIAGAGLAPGMAGRARIWLDRTLDPQWLASGQVPQPTGLRTEGLEVTTHDLQARIVADVVADADGRASGRLAIYTTDAAAVMDLAIEAGLLPPNVRILARTMLNRIGSMPFATAPTADDMAFPDPADGELRLPLQARSGRLYLGAIEIGSAPLLVLAQP